MFRKLEFNKFVIADLSCIFEISYYPFDIQECLIIIVNQETDIENVQLMEDELKYLGPTSVFQYEIEKVSFVKTKHENAIIVKIRFNRKILTAFLTIILPGVLICLVKNNLVFKIECNNRSFSFYLVFICNKLLF